MKWLVTGGGGYIGSHVVLELLNKEFEPVVLDIKPKENAFLKSRPYEYLQGDIRDKQLLNELFAKFHFEGVMNFAALKSADESVSKPDLYEEVNWKAVGNLIDAAISSGVRYFIQSSSAAVYGNSDDRYVDENSATNPVSPYGSTKLKAEELLSSAIDSGYIKGTSLRYFNAAGAEMPELIEKSAANLIPRVIGEYASGKTPVIYGDDYPTDDGTCVRDYVHVSDLATAHVLIAEKLRIGNVSKILNLGTGQGHSVKEVLRIVKEKMGSSIEPKIVSRRPGDPDFLVAKVDLAEIELGFRAHRTLEQMVESSISV